MDLYARADSEEQPAILTPWSLIHFTTGAASSSVFSFWTAELLHFGYELIGSKRIFNSLGFNITKSSSFINSVGDQAVFTVGRMMKKDSIWSLISFVLALVYIKLGVEF